MRILIIILLLLTASCSNNKVVKNRNFEDNNALIHIFDESLDDGNYTISVVGLAGTTSQDSKSFNVKVDTSKPTGLVISSIPYLCIGTEQSKPTLHLDDGYLDDDVVYYNVSLFDSENNYMIDFDIPYKLEDIKEMNIYEILKIVLVVLVGTYVISTLIHSFAEIIGIFKSVKSK